LKEPADTSKQLSEHAGASHIVNTRATDDPVGNVTAWEGLTHHLASVPFRSTPEHTPTPIVSPTERPALSLGSFVIGVAVIGAVVVALMLAALFSRPRRRKRE